MVEVIKLAYTYSTLEFGVLNHRNKNTSKTLNLANIQINSGIHANVVMMSLLDKHTCSVKVLYIYPMFCENKCLFQSVKKPDRKGNKSESLVQAIKANVRRFFFMNKKKHMKLKTKQLYHIQLTEDISKKTIKAQRVSLIFWQNTFCSAQGEQHVFGV